VRAEAELQALPIRNLYTRDHSPLLEEALNQSRERLMIISPWIKADVVDKDFLEKLEALLKRNVAVFIGYGNQQTTYGESCSATSGGQRPAESTRGQIFEFPFQETGGPARSEGPRRELHRKEV
jgi:hypothetical protein